jgi:hypothetical protein
MDEKRKEEIEKIKAEVKDLLNQIVIKTTGVNGSESVYLTCVRAYSKRVLDREYEAEHNEDQYYNSNCY